MPVRPYQTLADRLLHRRADAPLRRYLRAIRFEETFAERRFASRTGHPAHVSYDPASLRVHRAVWYDTVELSGWITTNSGVQGVRVSCPVGRQHGRRRYELISS